jgi:hypothetical protein
MLGTLIVHPSSYLFGSFAAFFCSPTIKDMSYPVLHVQIQQVASKFSSEISLQMTFNMEWNDSRLRDGQNCIGELDPEASRQIWRPDPYVFYSSFTNIVETMNGKSESITMSPEGLLWWMEADIGLQCPFDFSYYPFDVQRCKFMVSSTTSTISTLVFKTTKILDRSQFIQQELQYDIEFEKFNKAEDFSWMGMSGSNFSTTGFYVTLKRKSSASLITTFIPSFLVVLCSFFRNQLSSTNLL